MWRKQDLLRSFFRNHWKAVAVTFLASLLAGVATIAIPVAIGKYYDFLFGFHSQRARLLEYLPGNWNDMPTFLVLFFALVILKTLFSFAEKYGTGVLGEHLVYDLRNQLFWHQLKIPVSDYEERGAGRYLLRFSGDLKSIQNYLTRGILRFVSDGLLLLLAFGLLLALDLQLGLLTLAGLLLPIGAVWLLNRRLARATRRQRNRKSGLLDFTNMRLRAIHTIRFFNKEVPEQAKFEQRAEKVLSAGISYQRMVGLIQALVPGSLYLLLAGLFTFVYYRRPSGVDGGSILIFVILLMTLLPIFRRMLRVNVVWELGRISFEKLLNVLNRAEVELADLPRIRLEHGLIEVEELSFNYGKTQVFDRLNLHIPAKGVTVIQSPAGSGKTTLIKLLSGLYRPSAGSIRIDGQDISKVSGKSLRKNIALVSSELPLLGNNVFEAISYSRKADKRPPARLLLAHLQKHNPDLPPLKLDDPVGDLGSRLSKGQVKLLSYARAILTDKNILLLDEPFEGLDPSTIPFWIEQLHALARDKTVVVFSSKLVDQRLAGRRLDLKGQNGKGESSFVNLIAHK